MTSTLTLRSQHRAFGGMVSFWRHPSTSCAVEMGFSTYVPPQAASYPVPVLYCLAGLTCTEENFMVKGAAQRWAAEYGLMLVCPDTSPRQTQTPGEDAEWDFGTGAGFYVNALCEPWAKHYRMYDYCVQELPALIEDNFPVIAGRRGVCGHSMGGHGALVLALRNPDRYQSVSAFAPIAAPSRAPWGQKALGRYLGDDPKLWADYDASELVKKFHFPGTILIDQGTADSYLTEQLMPEVFADACYEAEQPFILRYQEGYDHGYYFISTFIADHLQHHAQALGCGESR
jgi:S-formylglutathione hydrolase